MASDQWSRSKFVPSPRFPKPSLEPFQEELAVLQISLPTIRITLNVKKLSVKMTTVV